MFQVKCADCGCSPRECKASPSAKKCPNCTSGGSFGFFKSESTDNLNAFKRRIIELTL